MKSIRKIIAGALITFMAVSTVGCNMVEKTQTAINAETVATVGNDKITRGDLENYYATIGTRNTFKTQYGSNYENDATAKEALKQQKSKILDQMITEKILLQKAKDMKLDTDTDKIKEEANKDKEDYKKNFVDAQGKFDQSKFDEQLKNIGLTEDTLTKVLIDNAIMTRVQDNATKDVKVDDNAAQDYYNNNTYQYLETPGKFHAAHILVATEDEAKKVKERLKNGEDFAKVAAEVSTDPGSKDKGGDLGEGSYTDFVKPFVDGVVATKVGEVSDPVKSDYGYHVIKVISKDDIKIKKFDAVKDQIKDTLLKTEQQKAFNNTLDQWKKDAKVETKKYEKNL